MMLATPMPGDKLYRFGIGFIQGAVIQDEHSLIWLD
jgi:hypothetical protein